MPNSPATSLVYCVGTADTKLDELRFLANAVTSNLSLFTSSKIQVITVDVSVSQKTDETIQDFNFVPRNDVLCCIGANTSLTEDSGEAVKLMSKALQLFLVKSGESNKLYGVIGVGGSGGTALLSPAFRSLPLGVPELIVSTVASGGTEPYVGTSDLVLFPSVVDVCGINSVSRVVLGNAAAAFAGMIAGRIVKCGGGEEGETKEVKKTVGLTMFGVTTKCVSGVKERLKREGYETLVFHATGVGGRAMESLVSQGFIQGVLDITTTEVADFVVGGVMACNSSRFDAII